MKKTLFSLTAATLMAAQVHAHFMFIELPEKSDEPARLRFAEEPAERTSTRMQEKAQPMRVQNQTGTPVTFELGDTALEAALPAGTEWLHGYLKYGVIDNGEDDGGAFLLNYFAKAVSGPEAAAVEIGTGIEVTAAWEGETVAAKVLRDGQPVAGAEILLDSSTSDETLERVTDADGAATFPAPAPGWIGLRARVVDETPGEHDGEAYNAIRSYATLTLEVGAPPLPKE